MKDPTELRFPDNVRYFEEHTWARQEGDLLAVGISDYAQDQLGEIIFVDLPVPNQFVGKNEVFGVVESVKTASDLYMPVSGDVVAVNPVLADAPELVSTNPYTDGWMIKVKPAEESQLESLMTADGYRQMLAQ